MDYALVEIRFHVLNGVKKGDLRKGRTSKRGAMLTLATANVLYVSVV